MALRNGGRWDRRQWSFVPFATMGHRRCVCVISEVSPTLLPSPGVPNPSCMGLWEKGGVKRAGKGRRARVSPGMAQKVVSSGEIFREASVDPGSCRGRHIEAGQMGQRCQPCGTWGAVAAGLWSLVSLSPGWTCPGAGSLCTGVPAGPCRAVAITAGPCGRAQCGAGGGEPRDIVECEAEPKHFMNGLI